MRQRWVALLLCVSASPLLAMELFEAPTHLRFSAREVSEAAQQHRSSPALPVDVCDESCARLQGVWRRLLPAAHQQPSGARADLKLSVVADGMSPFAAADGTVVFPVSLVDALSLSDAEIAFVMAHEIVHVLLEHEREILTGVDVFMRPDVRRSASDVYDAIGFDLGLSLKVSFLMQSAELEADAFGLQLAALAGFDPDRQVSALDKLLRSRDEQRAVMPTHPSDIERLRQVRGTLPIARAVFRAAAAM